MTVSPEKEEKSPSQPGEKKPKSLDELTAAAEKQRADKEFVNIDPDEGEYEYDSDVENQPQYLYMELKSTASFKDIDIDAMLEHTTFDDFMRGLYSTRVAQTSLKGDVKSNFEHMMSSVFADDPTELEQRNLKLRFEEQDKQDTTADVFDQSLEAQALANIRE